MRLYDYFRSSAAWRVRIALHWKGLPHERVPVHLLKDGGEQRGATYRALNPQGLVPALEHDGAVLGQSLAILEYLEEIQPEPRLLPADPLARAQVRAMALGIACDIHPLNNLRVLEYLKGPLGRDEAAVTAWYRHWIAEGFRALEELARRHSTGRRHLHGDALTLADVCLVPQMYNARRWDCDLAPYPVLVAIDAHLAALPAFMETRPGPEG